MLATLIDSYCTQRDDFQLNKGYQPINSLFYLKSGTFSCEIEGVKSILHPGDIVIFDRQTPMQRQIIEPICFLYIKFNSLEPSLFPIRSAVFEKPNLRALEDCARIESLSHLHTSVSLQIRTHYLNDLLLQLRGEYNTVKAESAEELLPSVLDAPIAYLRQNLASKIQVEDVAKSAGMSISALENKFRTLTNDSVYNYLIRIRMEKAKELLTETAYSITEIALRCGYENLFYFCNSFKKNTGMTPTGYRQSNLI